MHWDDAFIMQTVMRYMKDKDGKPTYTLDEKVAIYEDNSLEGQEREIEWEAEQLQHFKKHGLSFTDALVKAGEQLNMAPDTVRTRMKKIKYQVQWLEFKEKLRRK
jgi:hypothetical protein